MKKSIIILIFLAGYLHLHAQDLTGQWRLKERTSVSGPDYTNGIPETIGMIMENDSLTIYKRSTVQGGKPVLIKETFSTDGKPTIVPGTTSGRVSSSTLSLSADKTAFTLKTDISAAGDPKTVEFHIVETYHISDEKLNIQKEFISLKDSANHWVTKGSYEPEPAEEP